jgi:predicted ABC-type ATPase
MSNNDKRLYIVGGPNGAGKTTIAMGILSSALECYEYVNADSIAAALSPFAPESVSIEAGKIMLNRIRELSEKSLSFAFETTMASRSFVPFVKDCMLNGYTINYIFVWLISPELSIARVNKRVLAGGHDIPESTIRQRYERGISNFFNLYLDYADNWSVYDNSDESPQLVAENTYSTTQVFYPQTWELIKKGMQ